MEVKVLTTEPVLEINGVKFHHHPNGGGLVAENIRISPKEYIGFYSIIFGRPYKEDKQSKELEQEELTHVFQRVSDDWQLILPITTELVKKAIEYIELRWFDKVVIRETPGKLLRRDPGLGICVFLLCFMHLWPFGQKKFQTEAIYLKLFSKGKENSAEPWRNLSKIAKNIVKPIGRSRSISLRTLQDDIAPHFWEYCERNGIKWPEYMPKRPTRP